jgi:predicted phosphodiesterase
MRVAALYDIHGNLPALEAVLDEVDRAGVDRVIVGGDVLPGPMPGETLTRLKRLRCAVDYILGNCEVAALAELTAPGSSRVPEQVRESIRWSARQLAPGDDAFVASWPRTLRLDIAGVGPTLFCHGTPRSEDEIFTRTTAEERLLPLFDHLEAALVVCGHTHIQFDRLVGRTRVVNAGSVGMPFNGPGADWLLLGPDVELRHTEYDLDAAAVRIRGTAYPEAAVFADRYVLHPPTEAEMLAVYAGAELKGPPS